MSFLRKEWHESKDAIQQWKNDKRDAMIERDRQRYRAQMTMMNAKDETTKAIARNIWSQNM